MYNIIKWCSVAFLNACSTSLCENDGWDVQLEFHCFFFLYFKVKYYVYALYSNTHCSYIQYLRLVASSHCNIFVSFDIVLICLCHMCDMYTFWKKYERFCLKSFSERSHIIASLFIAVVYNLDIWTIISLQRVWFWTIESRVNELLKLLSVKELISRNILRNNDGVYISLKIHVILHEIIRTIYEVL